MSAGSAPPRPGWWGQVGFGPHGLPPAFQLGEVLVTGDPPDLDELVHSLGLAESWTTAEAQAEGWTKFAVSGRETLPDQSAETIEGVRAETLRLVDELRDRGVSAQLNHVFFADPFTANPFTANPFTANPFTANPFTANPFTANPFTANPFTANGNGWPAFDVHETGIRPSTADPAAPPAGDDDLTMLVTSAEQTRDIRVLVLDTGLPAENRTLKPILISQSPDGLDKPDEQPWDDGQLDPVAGHGMFIKSIITRLAPFAQVDVVKVLNGLGAGVEERIHAELMSNVGEYDLVSLSFGTYAPDFPRLLWEAIAALQRGGPLGADADRARAAVVVASAGNDATWAAPMPASLPGVVSVAALADDGCSPAWFSNYGPWVSACAPGEGIVADFWSWSEGKRPWGGGATWSGTSFAAPYVVGALAQAMNDHPWMDARDAVTVLIDDPSLPRLPWHGTIVKGR